MGYNINMQEIIFRFKDKYTFSLSPRDELNSEYSNMYMSRDYIDNIEVRITSYKNNIFFGDSINILFNDMSDLKEYTIQIDNITQSLEEFTRIITTLVNHDEINISENCTLIYNNYILLGGFKHQLVFMIMGDAYINTYTWRELT